MMHQQAASSHYASAQGGSQHYQGQPIAMMGQSGQGSSMMGPRALAPYRPSQQGACRPRAARAGPRGHVRTLGVGAAWGPEASIFLKVDEAGAHRGGWGRELVFVRGNAGLWGPSVGTAPGVPWLAWRLSRDPRLTEDALARAEGPVVTAVPRRPPPGSSQQYLGQEEYYGGEQYSHGQAASEPLSQQYYPDGEAHTRSGRGPGGFGLLPPSPAKHPVSPVPERDWGREEGGPGSGHTAAQAAASRLRGCLVPLPEGQRSLRPDVPSEQTVRLP